MSKSKILFVIPSLQKWGAESQTVKMINYLQKKYDVYLLTFTKQLDLKDQLRIDEKKLFFLDSNLLTLTFDKDFIFSYIKVMVSSIRIINNIKPTIVFANLPITHFVFRCIKSLHYYKFTLINIHRSLQFQANKPNILMRVFLLLNKKLSKNDYLNIFVSNASKRDQLMYFYIPSDKVKVINDGVTIKDKNYTKPSLFPKNKFIIVIAGRFVPEKNHKLFFTALYELINEDLISTNISVVLLGDGSLRRELEIFAIDNKIQEYIQFLGSVDNQEVLKWFKFSNLVVIPSKTEGFPNIAIEAILCKSRVLSSDAGGLSEIIEDNITGFLFKNKDKEDLKKSLIDIINHDKNYDRDEAYKIIKNKFSFESMINKYIEVIEDVEKK